MLSPLKGELSSLFLPSWLPKPQRQTCRQSRLVTREGALGLVSRLIGPKAVSSYPTSHNHQLLFACITLGFGFGGYKNLFRAWLHARYKLLV